MWQAVGGTVISTWTPLRDNVGGSRKPTRLFITIGQEAGVLILYIMEREELSISRDQPEDKHPVCSGRTVLGV